jgi:molybdopterin synthase catalytic subunit
MEMDIRVAETIPGASDAVALLSEREGGGIALFAGTTRRFTNGRETVRLSYEAHMSMAIAECRRLGTEAGERWPVLKLVLWHRLGDVPVGETSVLIGVATAHRAEAFEACRFLIDALKERVPIWKKEYFADGATEWVENGWN